MDIWLADGILTSGFTVAGHSLGGFLAGALLVDYPTEIEHAYLYNTPGIGGLKSTLQLLTGSDVAPTLDLSKVSNLIAETGPSLVAGLGVDWGVPIPVLIEDQTPNILDNHRIMHLTDSLAVQSMLSELSASEYPGDIREILRAATPQNAMTLETVVNTVGDLFQVGVEVTGTESDPRDALYQSGLCHPGPCRLSGGGRQSGRGVAGRDGP
ncbi:hypothetical protein [Thiohalophilus sp.]|uniref:hypothetical protein n=1 Tax=Thiohalophilus sp. TaxID=3028392 RepID=UPI002ACE07D7|nr:hypothetical protein [Thiohalophilus sp.]MDZ7805098.1 hypothetical protein [Thiohalophilus sp.]